MALSEKHIEDVFEVFYKQLISDDLELIARQYSFGGIRVDLLFRDSDNRNVVVELKKDAITREDVGQTLQYAGMIKDSRVILAAPVIASSIKTAFDHYGIDYIEFDLHQISRLYDQIRNKPKEDDFATKISVPVVTIRERLESRRKKDGNIAFKVTYVDSEWNGVCSPNLYEYNTTHRRWCGVQSKFSDNCQSPSYHEPNQLSEEFFPCFDSVALKTLRFSPGVDHGPTREGNPRRCLKAKVGKLAVFTSREPGEPESQRYVFAVAPIQTILPDENYGFELFCCNQQTALIFDRTNYPRFWNYYRNPNSPDRIVWGTGLYRYLADDIVQSLLIDVNNRDNFNKAQTQAAKQLLTLLK